MLKMKIELDTDKITAEGIHLNPGLEEFNTTEALLDLIDIIMNEEQMFLEDDTYVKEEDAPYPLFALLMKLDLASGAARYIANWTYEGDDDDPSNDIRRGYIIKNGVILDHREDTQTYPSFHCGKKA